MLPLPFVTFILWATIPLVIAALIAYALRTPESLRRIALVVYSIAFCLWALYPFAGVFRLGIDLSGGTILLYQIKPSGGETAGRDQMVSAVQRRVNPIGLTDVTIRGVGADRVEIIIPRAGKEDVDRCKRLLTDLGTLEFRILANRRDHEAVIRQADETFPQPVVTNGKTVASWIEVAPDSRGSFADSYGDIAVRNDGQGWRRVLVVQDDRNVTGELLRQATSSFDDYGAPAVSFRFNSEGSQRFGRLTGENRPDSDGFQRRLAIILNGQVHSAPSLREQISDQGIITGKFTEQEVADLVAILNAGALPGELDPTPISELSVGPTLGQDTVQGGLWAITFASATVFLFMLAYYRVAGLIADLAVILNVALVVAVMVWLKASFTLAGLAGLALTIGMSVDANVLIFERLREEQQAGKSLRTAIRNAFEKAMRPILDSNITTLLTGVMLYVIGNEQVRGFAITLVLGLIANLFTAVFVCRLTFDILERNGWLKQIGMFRLVTNTDWEFMRLRLAAAGASALFILIGIAAVGSRGSDLLDIDFTGGTLASVHLNQPVPTAKVRELISEALPDVSVEELQLRDAAAGEHYLIRTTLTDQKEVRSRLGSHLGEYIVRPTMTIGEFTALAEQTNDATATANLTPPPTDTLAGGPGALAADSTLPLNNRPKSLQARSFKTGHRAALSFDAPVTLAQLGSAVDTQIARRGVPDPETHYLLTGVAPATAASEGFVAVEIATDLPLEQIQTSLHEVARELAAQPVLDRLENFGGQVASEARVTAGLALIAGMAVIVVYLWVRFQNVLYGVGAVIALTHDVLVVLGLVGLSRWLAGNFVGEMLLIDAFKIDLPMVAAFLTLIGYSVNDTIVVFDRIREARARREPLSWALLNNSINQTLSRTLLTGLTTWMVAFILYSWGGPGIHGFAFILVAGVIVGTYSSIYIASPMLMWLGRKHVDSAPKPSIRLAVEGATKGAMSVSSAGLPGADFNGQPRTRHPKYKKRPKGRPSP